MNGYVKTDYGTVGNRGAHTDPQAIDTIANVQYAHVATVTTEMGEVLTGATVSIGGTNCTENGTTGIYYCSIPLADDGGVITVTKSGYVTNTGTNSNNRTSNADVKQTYNISNVLYTLKVIVADEYGTAVNIPEIATISFGMLTSPTVSATNTAYFAASTAGALSIQHLSFLNGETTNSGFSNITPVNTAQIVITLGNFGANAGPINSGNNPNNSKGLEFNTQITVNDGLTGITGLGNLTNFYFTGTSNTTCGQSSTRVCPDDLKFREIGNGIYKFALRRDLTSSYQIKYIDNDDDPYVDFIDSVPESISLNATTLTSKTVSLDKAGDHIELTPADGSLDAGGTEVITIKVIDNDGKRVTQGAHSTLSVTITLSGNSTYKDIIATTLTNSTNISGTSDISVTGRVTYGSATITITDKVAGTITVSASSEHELAQDVDDSRPININVNPTLATKLQILVPGETAAPGSPTGKTGTPSIQYAGVPFSITVNAVDDNWNVVPSGATSAMGIFISTSDPSDSHPSLGKLTGGTTIFGNITFKTATETGWVITATGALGLTATSSAMIVKPATAIKLVVTSSDPQIITAGQYSTITVQLQDEFNNPVSAPATTTLYLSSNSNYGNFDTNPDGTFQKNTIEIPVGNNQETFYYKDTKAGNAIITVRDSAYALATQQITVNPGNATKLQIILPGETALPGSDTGKSGTPTTQTAGTQFTFTVNAVDDYWNVNTSAINTISISTTDTTATIPSPAQLTSGTKDFNITFKTASSTGWTITATSTPLLDSHTTSYIVTSSGVPKKLAFTSAPNSITAGSITKYDFQLQDEYGNPANATTTTTITASTTSSAGKLDTSSSGSFSNSTTTITINAGSNSGSFYYMDTLTGQYLLNISASGLASTTTAVIVNSAEAASLFITPEVVSEVTVGSPTQKLAVGIKDRYNNIITPSYDINVSLSDDVTGTSKGLFSTTDWGSEITTITIFSSTSSASFYYKPLVAGTRTIWASSSNIASATISFTVNNVTQNIFHCK